MSREAKEHRCLWSETAMVSHNSVNMRKITELDTLNKWVDFMVYNFQP